MKWMKTLAVAAMLLTVSSGAYAQVNLKALKEKAKQEAERMKQEAAAKLKETVDSTVNAAKADVNKKAGEVLGAANEATGGLLDATGATAAVAGAAGLSGIGSFSGSSDFLNSGKTWYVSAGGSNKNDGASAATPLKNLQKAIDSAESGDIILVAEGNYLGTLDVGYIEITDKYLSLVGGYTADFSRFKDVDRISEYALPAFHWAVATGVLYGTDEGTLIPQETATRAQIASILTHFAQGYGF